MGYYVVYVGAGNHRACGYLSYAPFPAEKRGAGGIAAVGDRRCYRCGSPSFEVLVAGRALQAVSAGFTMP